LRELAPIVLFVYNRPEHTKKTLTALQQNQLASKSDLIVYSDAAKNSETQEEVNQVREILSLATGFKSVTVIEQEENQGLAKSIISGVSKVVNEYGKIIVLEDDLVTGPCFLNFMNDALDYYENEKKVWHVSGWNYPIDSTILPDTFLWRTMNCWGWATWADRWQYFEKNTDKLISSFSKDDINKFNLDGTENFWGQVVANKAGKINTWAIYWYATIFKEKGLCLNPATTYVDNIGLDGSGVHCGANDSYQCDLNMNNKLNYELTLNESSVALEQIKCFYKNQKKSILVRVINKLSRIAFGKNIIK